MRKIFTVVLLFSCYVSFAQIKSSITGKITDSTQTPLVYVTISLFKAKQANQLVKREITNKEGRFQIANIDTGSYLVAITHEGFIDRRIPVLISRTETDISTIQLKSKVKNLQSVTVTAVRPIIEASDDKIVFNVDQDPAAKAETAIEILRKTPFVSVDGDGNVQVNGQSNFKVLLNGRETAMFAQNIKQALQVFPGASIHKIEVITSPSAKYDAEGVGGIINIITVKKLKGYNGSLLKAYSTMGFLNSNLAFSLKTGRIGFVMNYSYGWNGRGLPSDLTTITTPYQASIYSQRILLGDRTTTFFFNFGNAEFTYDLDSLTVLSFYGNISGGSNNTETNQYFLTKANTGNIESWFSSSQKNTNPNYTIGGEYIKKFRRSREEELSIRAYGDFNDNSTLLKSFQDNPGTDRYLINDNKTINNQLTFQTDYIKPLASKTKLESGLKYIRREAISDFTSMIRYSPSTDYTPNPANTDYFNYEQEIYGAYGIVHFKMKQKSIRVGVRAERTVIKGSFKTTATGISQDYINLFPNAQLTFPTSKTMSFVVNYSQRVQRPFIQQLNPFVNDNDSLNIFYGNPRLQPQIFHALSVQTRATIGKVFAATSLTASYSGDKIVSYAIFTPSNGVTANIRDNIGREFQLNFNANLNATLSKKWRWNLNGNVQYVQVKNIMNETEQNRSIGYRVFTNFTFIPNPRLTFSANGTYTRIPPNFQTFFAGFGTYLISAGYKAFKQKLILSINVENFLAKSYRLGNVTETDIFKTESYSDHPYRLIRFSFTYSFGKLKENVSKKKGVFNDDALN